MRIALFGIGMLLTSAGAVPIGASPPTLIRSPECPWKVAVIREPRGGEMSFEDSTHYLRPSEWEERNKVFGPGGLVAHVRVHDRRGYLEIVNWQTGDDSLFVYPHAMLPSWSPDGRYLSANVWTEKTRMGKLAVFEVGGWKNVVDIDVSHAANTKWSPDSRMIACAGVAYRGSSIILYTVTVPEGRVSVVDSTRVPGDIDFSWSPNNRWLVYAMPTKVHHVGDTMVSDLWIADAASGAAWCLIKSTDHHQSNPLWITDTTIQLDRVWWTEEGANREQRVVVELRETR
jgi:hypothetical protein